MSTKRVVFIHGMYMTPLCWEHWVPRFQSNGYSCLTPAWPGRDTTVEELRRLHPDPQLPRLTLSRVVERLAAVVQALDEKPVLIGHSMGGLIVQLLVQRGVAAAGIAIDSAPPLGVFTTKWSFVRANWEHINPITNWNHPVEMTFERFQYAFANTLPLEKQRAAYERYIVPESRRVPMESLTGTARIHFRRPHAPLLLIAGSADTIIPASLNRSNYVRYRRSNGITDFKEFEGRTHFIIGQDGWEEVADHALNWLVSRLK